MTAAELRALARRVCEEQPSRELDGLIYMATLPAERRRPVDWKVIPETGQIYAWNRPPPHARGTGGVWARSPEYTTSLAASASMMPEGCGLEVRRYWLSKSISHAYDQIKHGPGDGVAWSVVALWGIAGECAVIEDCPTEPQARVAAALLAMAADMEARDAE